MRLGTLCLSMLIVLFMSTTVMSQNYAIESFSYTVGSTIDTLLGTAENGFSGPWYKQDGTDSLGAVSDTALDYDGTDYEIEHAGNHIQVNNPGAWVAARWMRPLESAWPDEAGAVYWLSFLFEAATTPSGNTYYIIKLYNTESSEIVAIGKGGGGTIYSCGSGWPGGSGDDVSDVQCEGGPVWLVTKMVMSGDDGNERTFMWINPDPSLEPDTLDANVKRNSTANDGFNILALECGGEDVMETHWDEIRLGTSYEAVSVTSLPRADQNIPVQFTLSQNYPNPFNPATQIEFSVLKKGNVEITVYDVSGKNVAVLVNEVLNSGNYKVQFSAVDLPSGIYFYRISTSTGMITKKMTLLK